MITADIILDTRSISKKGYPVKIRVYDTLEKIKSPHKYISLKIYQPGPELKFDSFLKKRNLDLDQEVIFCNENFYRLNDAIEIFQNGIPLDDIDIEIQMLEKRLELLRMKKGSKNDMGLIAFGKVLIQERTVRKKPIYAHQSILNTVEKFIFPQKDIFLNEITREWINLFDLYCLKKGVTDGTIYTYVCMIRAIFKEAQLRESLNVKKTNPFLNLRVFQKNKVTTELEIEDLIKIKNFDLIKKQDTSNFKLFEIKRLARVLLFQFCIGGHDLADIANLKWINLQNGRIRFKRFKNRYKSSSGEEVDNNLNQFCLEVINDYGDKENERIFSFLNDPNSYDYKKQIMLLNRYGYSAIAKYIESKNKFTSKSTRYLFRTTGGNLLIDSLMLMKLQGHTPQGVTFGYQGVINYEVQDREHQKILDLVFG